MEKGVSFQNLQAAAGCFTKSYELDNFKQHWLITFQQDATYRKINLVNKYMHL